MSATASDEEISNVGGTDHRHGCQGGGNGDEDEDEDDDDTGIGIGMKPQNHRRRTICGFARDIGKPKQVILRQFTKAKNKLRRTRINRVIFRPSSSSSGSESTGSGKMIRTRCNFCFSCPQALESLNGSPTSDPNDPNFTHAMLKTLIEKNDFYSKECNPHID